MQKKFYDIVKDREAIVKVLDKQFNIIGYVKLFIVLLFGVAVYLSIGFHLGFIGLLSVFCLAFIIIAVFHSKLKKKIIKHNEIISICNRHIDRITGKWINFDDAGEEFINIEHRFSSDLDIVGERSLFQFLNTTNTWYGRQAFSQDLLSATYSPNEIESRQGAILELSKDIDFSNDVEFCLSKVAVDDKTPKLVNELANKQIFIAKNTVKHIVNFLPILTFLAIISLCILQPSWVYFAVTLIIVAQISVWILCLGRTQKYFGQLIQLTFKLDAYNEIIKTLTGKEYANEKLQQIKQTLLEATQGIKELGMIANRVSVRYNGIVYFFMNALFWWDFRCAVKLQKWKEKYSNHVEKWFSTIGEFESLLSFSHLPKICTNVCLPKINNANAMLDAKAIGHPLLPNEKRVNNDFGLDNNILIISGSNMSGKTTFLRTIGINIVLARAGGFVCAKEMTLSLFDVMTSMRIVDNLNEGVSTFYAELKRIKGIIDFATEKSKMLFLIDEIFRGTNSVDRLMGAKTVIEKLNNLGVIGFISTHDLELCGLAEEYERIKNYNFSEYYKHKKISFDYKIKQGKSTTTNAKHLMEMVGIVERSGTTQIK